jgi:hypothetical protein
MESIEQQKENFKLLEVQQAIDNLIDQVDELHFYGKVSLLLTLREAHENIKRTITGS